MMTSLIIYIGCVYVVLLIRLSAFALSDSCRCTKWIRHLSGISCKKHFLSTIRKLNFPISFHFVCSVVVGFSTHVSSVSNGNRFFFLFSFSLNLFEILVCGCAGVFVCAFSLSHLPCFSSQFHEINILWYQLK